MYGYNVGSLMRSWDSPHPCAIFPQCSGINKHTVYAYKFPEHSDNKAFTKTTDISSENVSLAIQAEIRVPQFEAFRSDNGGPPISPVTGQMAFGLYLKDPNGLMLKYVILVFDNNPDNSPIPVIGDEWVGQTYNGAFIIGGADRSVRNSFYRLKSDSISSYSKSTWSDLRFFRIHITPADLQRAARAVNAVNTINNQPLLSENPFAYKVDEFFINQEVNYKNNGVDHWVFSASHYALGLFELVQ